MMQQPPVPVSLPVAGGFLFIPQVHASKPNHAPRMRRLTGDDLAMAGFAAVASDQGLEGVGLAALRRLEERWGLTGYERLAGMVQTGQIEVAEAAALRQASTAPHRECRRTYEKAAIKRATLLNAPLAEVRPSEAVRRLQQAALAAVDALDALRAAKPPAERADIRKALVAVREAQSAYDKGRIEQDDARWRGFADAEAQDQAKARGDSVERFEIEVVGWAVDDDGNRVLDNRGRPSLVVTTALAMVNPDGLDKLLAAGSIDRNEYLAGGRYHEIYRAVDPESALTPGDPGRVGGRTPHDPFSEAACKLLHKHIEATKSLIGLDAAAAQAIRDKYPDARANRYVPEGIAMLRAVAGKGQSIREAASCGGYKRERLTGLLKIALAALAGEVGLR